MKIICIFMTKHIVISEKNYIHLKKLGTAGDSFNDVITDLLKINNSKPKQPAKNSLDSLVEEFR